VGRVNAEGTNLVPAVFRPHHIGITVRSLENSVAFYRDRIGLEEVLAANMTAPYVGELLGYEQLDLRIVVMRMPNSDWCLELLEYRNIESESIDPRNGNVGTAHLAFMVDDLDREYERLTDGGVAAVSPPVEPTEGPNKGGKVVYMIDPDGVRIELIQHSQSFADHASSASACAKPGLK